MLPVEAHTTARAPPSSALAMARNIPRSLKEPVGLEPSSLRKTSQPVFSERAGAGTRGVLPSPSVRRGVWGVRGRRAP